MDKLYDICKKTFNEEQFALLGKAVAFAKNVHKDQKRESGEPYYIHPEAVAIMLYNMGMDYATVIAGLLHDVVEDGKDVTVDQIKSMFGTEIGSMVDGVTKLTQSGEQNYVTKREQQAENLRKLFLAMANNVRVVIIKLADRLHNMRTLEYCDTAKRVRKAKETLEVYAPLAHRFGMGAIKGELEDLAFMHMTPEEYERMRTAIEPQQAERMQLLQNAMQAIRDNLEKINVKADINGRPKHLYSIYRKMVKQNRPLDEIYDLIAIRIIVDTVSDCYATLGVIHSIWRPMPGRFKDYIAMPKTNMYRSLHTTLFNDQGMPFEIQIRTFDMHRTAEYGIAAHWMYKEGRHAQDDLDDKMQWLRNALEYENDADSTRDFVDGVVKDFFSDYVFVLTPTGEILDMPTGSTPLDFAYRIHTNVGHHCQHAKVNGNMMRLDYKLKTNDVVEIITSANQPGPSRDWLNIVKTQQAKTKIRQWFKKANREENVQKGREMLEGAAKRLGQQFSTLTKPEFYGDLLKKLNMTSLDDIYNAVGYGGISSGHVIHRLMDRRHKELQEEELQKRLTQAEDGDVQAIARKETRPAAGSRGIIVRGEPNMMVRFAHCCSPVPGDEIIGYITRGRGVSIHRRDCPNARELLADEDRIIPVEWAGDAKSNYTASINITATNRPGVLIDVSQTALGANINIKTVNAKTERDGMVYVQLSFDISNTAQLSNVIKAFKKIKGVTEVFRTSN
ncbi:MAG: bifunctional (p)ppGpp synthetase/guanosine-3',5'-bis(diphosphate) 3'-pyrophosphohydrolase [Clostridiales bacterium]|jgi:GTP pyrophosphokinase|nr:bifunctional (p)ppGpp synthetase/guanosine-3',5'-bis(diphosphate) 3'-pyrophosphohydrolase [Clostridiales bacterium]